jgi:uncharacterized protein
MTSQRIGFGASLGLRGIAAYQALRAGRPTSCRFLPSCSAYADEAIRVHGLWRGGRLAVARLARCHPFGRHGVDAVPPAQGLAR